MPIIRKENMNYKIKDLKSQLYNRSLPELHMKQLNTLLRWLFFAFVGSLLLNRHHIFFSISPKIYGNFSDLTAISLYIQDILAVVLGVVGLIKWASRSDFRPKNPYFTAFFAYTDAILLLFLILPRETSFSCYFSAKYLIYALILIGVSATFEGIQTKWLYLGVILMGVFESIVATAQFYLQKSIGLKFLGETALYLQQGIAKIDLATHKLIRPYGTFAHPNILSAFLIVACATAFSSLFKQDRKTFIFSAAALTFFTYANILTFSRSGIVAETLVCGVLLCLFYMKLKIEAKQIILGTGAMIIILIGSVLALKPYLLSRATISDSSTINRISYDKTGLEIFKKHWLIGVGPGNILQEVAKTGEYPESWQVQPPHNYFILVACETGIVGLFLFLLLIWMMLSTLYEKIGEGDSKSILNAVLFSVLIGYIFLMMFDHYFYDIEQGQLLLWTLIAIIIARIRAYNLVAE